MILVGQDSGSLVHKSIMLNYLFTYTSNKEFCETFNIYPNQGIFFKSLKVCKYVCKRYETKYVLHIALTKKKVQ